MISRLFLTYHGGFFDAKNPKHHLLTIEESRLSLLCVTVNPSNVIFLTQI